MYLKFTLINGVKFECDFIKKFSDCTSFKSHVINFYREGAGVPPLAQS